VFFAKLGGYALFSLTFLNYFLMQRTENNLPQDAHASSVAATSRHEAIPTLLQFLNANGSKWCRISIKPNKVLLSFRDGQNNYHYGSGQTLPIAYNALQARLLKFTA
jgi:hypothetical protein